MANINANQKITEYIIKQIEEKKVLPWQCGFSDGGMPRNYATGRMYSGRNIVTCIISGWSKPYFMTYPQAQKLGGQVRKGEHGIPILYAQSAHREVDEDTGEERFHCGAAKAYTVFNIAQIDGIDESRIETGDNPSIEDFLMHIPVTFVRGKRSAWYIGTDKIGIPMRSEFSDENEYYSNILHELVHWTGMALGREQVTAEENIESYSYEELVAELGACFLRAHFKINYTQNLENSTAYLDGWLKVLKNDTSMILRASKDAQRACDRLIHLAEVNTSPEEKTQDFTGMMVSVN